MAVIGINKAGKSTLLKKLTKIEFFPSGVIKETSNFWNILENREETIIPVTLTKVQNFGQKIIPVTLTEVQNFGQKKS